MAPDRGMFGNITIGGFQGRDESRPYRARASSMNINTPCIGST